MKLLIVDDNQKVRGLIRSVVERYDPVVAECDNGKEAIKLYERERPDCVLMDIEMRPMDGLEAAIVIKEAHPHARIVFVTQHSDGLFRKAAEDCGASGYVLKQNLMGLTEILDKLFPERKESQIKKQSSQTRRGI